MAALCTAGVANTNEAIVNAKKYLVSKFVKSSGAFESAFGVNTDANAWAVQGLKACGIDPQEAEFTGTAPAKKTPLNFLISQQVSGGGFRYGTSGSTPDEYASQDAARALGGAAVNPPLKICSVSLAPETTVTTLATVLNAAVAGTTPASCVTGFLPSSGEGAVTQVNGFPASPAE